MTTFGPLPLAALQQVGGAVAPGGIAAASPPSLAGPGGAFAELVGGALRKVNDQLLTSQADLQQLAVGNVENLHQILIRLEESRLSFQLAMQVRNRVLEAYQDLMKLQV